jgi:hypothetical protein
MTIQKQLVSMVRESFRLQDQSKVMLDTAKYAVELAIEENEEAAIKWLKKGVFPVARTSYIA